MRVLVIGAGGREHTMAWKLKLSPQVTELYCAPGNPGIAGLADCVDIDPSDIVKIPPGGAAFQCGSGSLEERTQAAHALPAPIEIDGVPPGTYKVKAWHPNLGLQVSEVTVEAGAAADANFAFTAK